MAGGWSMPPVYGAAISFGQSTATSGGTLLTSGGTTNVKGAWTQLTAATSADINRLVLHMNMRSMISLVAVLDLSMGSSGNETAGMIIANLIVSTAGDLGVCLELPVHIPAGSPVTVRFAAETASDTMNMSCTGFQSGYTEVLNAGVYETWGYLGSGAVTGRNVDSGGTANTKGVYRSTTVANDLAGFFIGFDITNYSPVSAVNCDALFDVAFGATGSEVVIVPNYAHSKLTGSGFTVHGPSFTPIIWIPIPAGSQVNIRSQCPTITSNLRSNGVSFYGIRT